MMNFTTQNAEVSNVTAFVPNFQENLSEKEVFGRHEFILTKPMTAIPTIAILSLASFIGTAGNVLTLLAIASSKNLRNVESIFIVNLAISDLYVTMIADPMSIVAKLEGEIFFNSIPRLCQIIGNICTISCVTSLMTIATMSFNRYIYVCRSDYYRIIFSKRNSIIICCCLYCVGLTLVLLNQAGIGDHGYDRKSMECIWDRMATFSYTVIFSVTLVWIPCLVIGVCYLKLYLFVRRHKKKVNNHRHGINNLVIPAAPSKPRPKLGKTFILIYAVFVTCWAPYALLMVLDLEDSFPYEVHLYITMFAHLHPSINWLIYYFTHRKISHAYCRLLGCSKENTSAASKNYTLGDEPISKSRISDDNLKQSGNINGQQQRCQRDLSAQASVNFIDIKPIFRPVFNEIEKAEEDSGIDCLTCDKSNSPNSNGLTHGMLSDNIRSDKAYLGSSDNLQSGNVATPSDIDNISVNLTSHIQDESSACNLNVMKSNASI